MSNPRQYPLVLGVNSKNQADQLIEASALKLESLVVSSISATEFLGLNLTGIQVTVPTGVYITTAIYYEGTGTFLPKPSPNPANPVVVVYNPTTGTTNESFPYAVNTTGPATAVSLWTYQGLKDRFLEIPGLAGGGNHILVFNNTNDTVQGFRVADAESGQVLGHDGAGNLDWVTVCGTGGPVCGVTAHDQLANVLVDVTSPGNTTSHWTYNTLQSLFVEPSELSVYATTATTALTNYVRINLPTTQTITGPIRINSSFGVTGPTTFTGTVSFLSPVVGLDATEVIITSLAGGMFGTTTGTVQNYVQGVDSFLEQHINDYINRTDDPTQASHWTYNILTGTFAFRSSLNNYTTTADFTTLQSNVTTHLNSTGTGTDPHPQYINQSELTGQLGNYATTANLANYTLVTTFNQATALLATTAALNQATATLTPLTTFNQATGTLVPQNTGTALGDLLYFSTGTNKFIRLPIGSTDQVLKVVGGLPAWATQATGTSTVQVLDDLTDVAIAAPTAGQVLYKTGKSTTAADSWVNQRLPHSDLTGVVLDSTAAGQVGHYTIEFLNNRYVQPATTALVNYFTSTESNNRYVATGTFYSTTAILATTASLGNYTTTATFNQTTAILATTASLGNYTLTSTFNQATSVLTPTATFVQATALLTPTSIFYSTTATLNNKFNNYTLTATFNQATSVLATTASLANYTKITDFNQATSVLTTTAVFNQATATLTPLATFNQTTAILATTASLTNYTLTSVFYPATATLTNTFVNYTPTSTFNQATALLTPTSIFYSTTATLNNRFVNYTLTSTYNNHVNDSSIHFTVDSIATLYTTTGLFYATTALLTPTATFNQATSVLATTASLNNYTTTSLFYSTTATLNNRFVNYTPTATFNQTTAILATTASLINYTPTSTFNQATALLATTASLANYTLLTTFNQATSLLTPTATFYSTTATLLPKTGGTITGPLIINSNLNVTGGLIVTGSTTFIGTVNGIDATEIVVTSFAGGNLGPSPVTGTLQNYTQLIDFYLDNHIEDYIAPTGTGTPGHWNEVQLTGILKNTFVQLNATGTYITTANLATRIEQQVDLENLKNVEIAGFYELTDGDVLAYKDGLWINSPQTQTSFWDPSQFENNIVGPEAGQILILSGDLSSIDRSSTNISSLERHLAGFYGVHGSSVHHYLSSLDQRYLPASGIFSGVVAVQALSSVDYIEFDLSANVAREEGRLYWNDTYKTLELDSANQTSIMLGQEVVVRVLNNTAQTFTRGQVVYISGTSSNVPTIALATASSEATTHKGLGVLKQTLTSGQRGLMSTFGLVSGVDTSIYNVGDILYLGVTPGTLTNVYAAAPSHPELIGSVVTVGTSSTGSILVQVQHGYEIQELHNVSRTQANTTGQVLVWNETSGFYAPGLHNDLGGLTSGNPHTQYATLSGATFTGNVSAPELSSTSSTVFSKLIIGSSISSINSNTNPGIYFKARSVQNAPPFIYNAVDDVLYAVPNYGQGKSFIVGDGVNIYYKFDNSRFGIKYGTGLAYLTTDANETFAQRNGTNSQTFNIYKTYTNASSFERAALTFNTSAFSIAPQSLGTGLPRALDLSSPNSGVNVYIGNGQSAGLKIRASGTGSNLDIYGHPTANLTYIYTDNGLNLQAANAVVGITGGTERFRISNTGIGFYGGLNSVFGLGTNGYTPTARVQIVGTSSNNLVLDVSSEWNTASGPTAFRLNILDTSSATSGLLLNLQKNGVSQFTVRKDGLVTANSDVQGRYWFGQGLVQVGTAALIYKDADNVLAQRNGAASQAFRIYNTYTDASNYERAGLNWNASAFEIETEASGTGIARNLIIGTSGTPRMVFSGTGARIDTSGMFVAGLIYPNNQTNYFIGSESNRIVFRGSNGNYFFSTDVNSNIQTASQGSFGFTNTGGRADYNSDTYIQRESSGLFKFTSSIHALSSVVADVRMQTPELSTTNISATNGYINSLALGGATLGGGGDITLPTASLIKWGTGSTISGSNSLGITITSNTNTPITLNAGNKTVTAPSSLISASSVSATNITGVNTYATTLSATNISAVNYYGNQISKSISIINPSSTENITIFNANEDYEIVEMVAVLRGSTPSITWTVRKDSSRAGTGTEVVTGGTTTTSTTTGSVVTSFNSNTVPNGNFVWLAITAKSGTVSEYHLTIHMKKVAGVGGI